MNENIFTIDDSKFSRAEEARGSMRGKALFDSMRIAFRIKDEQDAIESISWDLLPPGVPCDLPERILYYKGAAAWFPIGGKWLLFPFTGKNPDAWGRWQWLTPLPFTGTSDVKDKEIKPLFEDKWFRAVYEVPEPEEITPEYLESVCVPMYDYSRQLSQTVMPAAAVMSPLIDVMAEAIPFARTALINGTGISGYRISNENQTSEVYRAASAVYRAALNGERWVPMVEGTSAGGGEQLPNATALNVQDNLLAAQSFDNLRLSFHGLSNGGIFEKKQKMLDNEVSMDMNQATRTLQNRVKLRQEACTILNSITGVIAWCDASENATAYDKNADGILMDDMTEDYVPAADEGGAEDEL